MKVLHFFKTYLPRTHGGVERVIHNLCTGCRPHGVDASLLTVADKAGPYPDNVNGVDVHWAAPTVNIASTDISIDALKRFKVLSRQFDIIHYHFPWPLMDVAHFISGANKPSVVTYHSDIVRQKYLSRVYAPLMRKFLNSVDRVVATSPSYIESSPVLRRLKAPVESIPLGIGDGSYPDVPPELEKNWSDQLGRKYLVFVGVLRYYKGLHVLLDALEGLNYPLVIVGGGQREAELKEQAARLGLTNIHFLGVLSDEDKMAIMSNAYAVVFPSIYRTEAFGITLLEGALLGRPLISTELKTGTSYANAHEQTGLVVPPSNPRALRDALRRLWNDEAEAARFGLAARKRYEQLFTIDAMSTAYVDVYRSVLESRR